MFRKRRIAKLVPVLLAAAVAAVVISGCAFIKPGSLTGSQPAGIGSVRVHFELCSIGGIESCGPNEETETLQYLLGVAVPPGSEAPPTVTAVSTKGGPPIVFTRSDLVSSELAASSLAMQKAIGELEGGEEAEVELLKSLIGTLWPPTGLQGFGYLSAPVTEVEGETPEWTVDGDFSLPITADGGPYPGPFATAVAFGFREVTAEQPSSRPVHCLRAAPEVEPSDGDAICTGSVQQLPVGTADLRIAAPNKKTAQAFVGGKAKIAFPLNFASSGAAIPTFALRATTTAKGGKVKLGSASLTPGAPDPTTHLSPTANGRVTVTLPRGIKPGVYSVGLTATTPQGGTTSQVARLKVTKPKLKLRGVRRNVRKGTAILQVKVPGAGRLTIFGKGVVKVKKRAKKPKTLKVRIAARGKAKSLLTATGKTKLRVRAVFKPSSGIAAKKSKAIVLRLR